MLVALAAIWGAAFMLIEIALRDLAPVSVAAGRILFAAVTLALIAVVRRADVLPGLRRNVVPLGIAAVLNTTVPFVLIPLGQTEIDSGTAAILNAAVSPLVAAYVARLRRELGPGRLRLMRSSLGIVPSDEVQRFPARAMFSGPAGGVLATERLAAAVRTERAAAFDMGGTSTDVCLVQRGRLGTDQGSIAGLPLPLPAIDLHTVGCGGGSIAFLEERYVDSLAETLEQETGFDADLDHLALFGTCAACKAKQTGPR